MSTPPNLDLVISEQRARRGKTGLDISDYQDLKRTYFELKRAGNPEAANIKKKIKDIKALVRPTTPAAAPASASSQMQFSVQEFTLSRNQDHSYSVQGRQLRNQDDGQIVCTSMQCVMEEDKARAMLFGQQGMLSGMQFLPHL